MKSRTSKALQYFILCIVKKIFGSTLGSATFASRIVPASNSPSQRLFVTNYWKHDSRKDGAYGRRENILVYVWRGWGIDLVNLGSIAPESGKAKVHTVPCRSAGKGQQSPSPLPRPRAKVRENSIPIEPSVCN